MVLLGVVTYSEGLHEPEEEDRKAKRSEEYHCPHEPEEEEEKAKRSEKYHCAHPVVVM